MSSDRSLKSASALRRHRNVLTRAERMAHVQDQQKWAGKSDSGHGQLVERIAGASGQAKKLRTASLGLKSRESIELVDQINKGLPITAWDNFIQFSGLTTNEVAEVVMLPLRTLSRRRQKGRMEAAESDRLLRFSMILDKVVELFEGDKVAARQWLRTPQAALGGRTPIGFSQTTVGAREVEDLIGRLERGVYT